MSFRSLVSLVVLAVAVPIAGCSTRGRVRVVESCNPDPDSRALLCFDKAGLYYEIPYSELNGPGQKKKYACTFADDFKYLLEEIRNK